MIAEIKEMIERYKQGKPIGFAQEIEDLIAETKAKERERCAQVAQDYYKSIISCKNTADETHVRMHVEYQWCEGIAAEIRALKNEG